MRTLTFCVLLVVGGTLAALPFRQNQSSPYDGAEPGEATGPTQSELRQSSLDLFVESEQPVQLDRYVPAGLPQWNAPDVSSSRPPVPSSFEEVAVPLRLDTYDEERLSVSATKQLKRQAAKPPVTDRLTQGTFRPMRVDPRKMTNGEVQIARSDAGRASEQQFGSAFRNLAKTNQPRSVLVQPGDPMLPEPKRSGKNAPGTAAPGVAAPGAANQGTATLASTSKAKPANDAAANDAAANGPPSSFLEAEQRLPRQESSLRKRYWIRQPD